MATPEGKPTVLALLHNNHVAVYAGREQLAVYEAVEVLKPENVEKLRLFWEDQNGNP